MTMRYTARKAEQMDAMYEAEEDNNDPMPAQIMRTRGAGKIGDRPVQSYKE